MVSQNCSGVRLVRGGRRASLVNRLMRRRIDFGAIALVVFGVLLLLFVLAGRASAGDTVNGQSVAYCTKQIAQGQQ